MRIGVVLADSDEAIGEKVAAAVARRLGVAFRGAAGPIRDGIGRLCGRLISRSGEYSELVRGELLAELGIPDVQTRLDAVLGAVARGVTVRVADVRASGGRVTGGFSVGILRADFGEILGLAAASYVSAPSGQTIPWLRWLTLDGDQILVYDHEITYDLSESDRHRSRSGLALMRPGSGWRVPPEYAGTAGSNWLTKAFDVPGVEAAIAAISKAEIERRL